jgi:hypothetical protein
VSVLHVLQVDLGWSAMRLRKISTRDAGHDSIDQALPHGTVAWFEDGRRLSLDRSVVDSQSQRDKESDTNGSTHHTGGRAHTILRFLKGSLSEPRLLTCYAIGASRGVAKFPRTCQY